jgi:phage terminase large subunit-like protein
MDSWQSVEEIALDSPHLAELVLEKELLRRERTKGRIYDYFPDTGPFRRELYKKHLEFFEAGARYRERCFMAANRIGKTETAGGYETALHLTGLYPTWWQGKRFEGHIRAWAAGKTNETTRDIVQRKLLGPKGDFGTGLIPGNRIGRITWKQGVQDLIDTVQIRRDDGYWSILGFKSYQQGRGSFEGTEQHWVWLDEEPPMDIYGECIIRTATTNGLIILTFTPLEGMSEVTMSFLPKNA